MFWGPIEALFLTVRLVDCGIIGSRDLQGNVLVLAGTAMSADLSCPRNPADTATEFDFDLPWPLAPKHLCKVGSESQRGIASAAGARPRAARGRGPALPPPW